VPETTGKQKAGIAGITAAMVAAGGLYTAVHGSHSETKAISRNDTPVVINRPHDANGSPLPVTVITPGPNGGPPIVIVGAEPPRCFYGGTEAKPLPDPHCTPGATRLVSVSEVCTPGTAADARHVTAAQKKRVVEAYGASPFKGEIDHLISLQLGGSNDIKNLWPEAGKVPNGKDAVENRLHAWVCKKPTLARLHAAQKAIRTNWTTAERIITP
jgi:hypothetical protein